MRSFGVCCSEGLQLPAVFLVYVDYFLFLLFFFSPLKFVDVSSYLCVRFRLKPEEQNSRLGKEKAILKTFILEGSLLGGGEIASK